MEMAVGLVSALSLLSCACAQTWDVTFTSGPLTGGAGSCVTIPCSFTYPAGWTVTAVTWIRGTERVTNHSCKPPSNPDVQGRFRYRGDCANSCSLRVVGLRPSDQGTYYFRFWVQRPDRSDTWTSRTGQELTVVARPCQPSLGSRMEPGPSLTCSVAPACRQPLHWYRRDGASWSPSPTLDRAGAPELQISPSRLDPGAVLSCRVGGSRDECGIDQPPPAGTDTPRVEVRWPPGKTALREGDGFTLHCQAAVLWAVARYIWSRGDVWLSEAGQDLRIEKATESDGGNYTCGVWVSGPSWGVLSLSVRMSVEVQYLPRGVRVTPVLGTTPREGDSVTLTCSYNSSLPAPTSYTWYRDNQTLQGSAQQRELTNVRAEHAGEYRCQADNGIGQSQSPPISITVWYAPKGVNITVVPGSAPEKGSTVNLTCYFNSSVPADVNYTWYRNNTRLPVSQPQLVFEKFTESESGAYRCQVQNEVGMVFSPFINITLPATSSLWINTYILAPAGAILLLLLMGLIGVMTWRRRWIKEEAMRSNLFQPGSGVTPAAECIYENTQHYGMEQPAHPALPQPPSMPTEVNPGSPDATGESHIYSQPMRVDKVPQDDSDEVQYSVLQLQHPTQRTEPADDVTCEYAIVKR